MSDDIVIESDIDYQRDGTDILFEERVVMASGDTLVIEWGLVLDEDGDIVDEKIDNVIHQMRLPAPPKRIE